MAKTKEEAVAWKQTKETKSDPEEDTNGDWFLKSIQ